MSPMVCFEVDDVIEYIILFSDVIKHRVVVICVSFSGSIGSHDLVLYGI